MVNKDEQDLLKFYISNFYLKDIFKLNKNWTIGSTVEFIVRPNCNQKCQYCYITNYGDKLYPQSERLSKIDIINNIDSILEWLIQNKIFIPQFEIFAGDLFYDNCIYEIFDIFLKHYQNVNQNIFNDFGKIKLLLPINGYFLQYKEHQDKIKKYTNQLREQNILLKFSISTDGLYAIETREQTNLNQSITQQYYDTLFPFLKEMQYEVHPMIAACNIENSIKNFDWWIEMYDKYKLSCYPLTRFPTFLEVRNDDWTEEKIQFFKNFLIHVWNKKVLYTESIEKLAKHLFLNDKSTFFVNNYDICKIQWYQFTNYEDELTCRMPNRFYINISNLTFPICHRLTYPQFNAGQLVQDKNNNIIDIIPKQGLSSYIGIKTLQPKFYPKCNNCLYKNCCMKGCLGSQYESSGEILYPIENVCQLEQTKINTLKNLYKDSGVLEYAINNNLIANNNFKKFLLS